MIASLNTTSTLTEPYLILKFVLQAQRFLNSHAAVYNLFNLGRCLISVNNYRYFRLRAFVS